MDAICRLCSLESSSSRSLFSIVDGRLLLDMVTLICPIKVAADDSLPTSVCGLCFKIVRDANALRVRSVETDLKLRSANFARESDEFPGDCRSGDELLQMRPEVFIKQEKESDLFLNFGADREQDDTEPEDSTDNDDFQPKRRKTRKVWLPEANRTPIDPDLNKKVKAYFTPPVAGSRRWGCKVCGKSYAGNVNNLKDHVMLSHKDIAAALNLPKKHRLKNDEVMVKMQYFGDSQSLS